VKQRAKKKITSFASEEVNCTKSTAEAGPACRQASLVS